MVPLCHYDRVGGFPFFRVYGVGSECRVEG